jgi:hypothetical protein
VTPIDGADIINESITTEKTDFIVKGNNLFNAQLKINGGYISSTTGNIVNNAAWWRSDYIEVEPSTVYSFNTIWNLAYYTAEKVFISGNADVVNQITTPETAYYVRFSNLLTSPAESTMFNLGASVLPFEPYNEKLKYANSALFNSIPRIILPIKIDAVVGMKQQIFFRSIIEDLDPYKYNIKVTGTIVLGTFDGRIYPRYFEFTPTETGTKTFIISLYDKDDNLVTTKTTNIVAVNAKSSASLTKILCVGDSLTNNGQWVKEFQRMMAQTGGTPTGLGITNIQFIGTTGLAPALREGHSGKTWTFFNETTSPFYNGSEIDFADYVTTNSFGSIDYNYIMLTWNGQALGRKNASDHAALIVQAKLYLDKLKAAFPSVKVKLMGIPLPDNKGGIAGNGSTNYNNYYGLVQTVNGLNLAYEALVLESPYNTYCEFVNVSCMFDSENNYPYDDIPVNTRNTVTEKRANNAGIHPDYSGQNQIADVVYRNFNAN